MVVVHCLVFHVSSLLSKFSKWIERSSFLIYLLQISITWKVWSPIKIGKGPNRPNGPSRGVLMATMQPGLTPQAKALTSSVAYSQASQEKNALKTVHGK